MNIEIKTHTLNKRLQAIITDGLYKNKDDIMFAIVDITRDISNLAEQWAAKYPIYDYQIYVDSLVLPEINFDFLSSFFKIKVYQQYCALLINFNIKKVLVSFCLQTNNTFTDNKEDFINNVAAQITAIFYSWAKYSMMSKEMNEFEFSNRYVKYNKIDDDLNFLTNPINMESLCELSALQIVNTMLGKTKDIYSFMNDLMLNRDQFEEFVKDVPMLDFYYQMYLSKDGKFENLCDEKFLLFLSERLEYHWEMSLNHVSK